MGFEIIQVIHKFAYFLIGGAVISSYQFNRYLDIYVYQVSNDVIGWPNSNRNKNHYGIHMQLDNVLSLGTGLEIHR